MVGTAVPKLSTRYDDASCSVVHDHSYQRFETSSILGTLNINVLGNLILSLTSSLYRYMYLCIKMNFSDDCESSSSTCNEQDDNASSSDESELEDKEEITHTTQNIRHCEDDT